MDVRILLAVFLLACFCAPGRGEVAWTPAEGWRTSRVEAHGEGAPAFRKAFDLLLDGRYHKAAEAFSECMEHAGEPLREQAAILRAESLLADNAYRSAFEAYEDFLEEYPNSRHGDRALEGELEVARALLAGARVKFLGLRLWTSYGLAEKVVDKIMSHRPLSDYARLAQILLARSYFERELYIESASAYRQYVELYPNGPEVREALLEMGRSILADANGPEYDPVPYYRTCAVTGDLLRQYPGAPEAQATLRLRRRARENLGEHHFNVAKWYLKMGKIEAAVLYFRKVVEEYHETHWADRAWAILETLGEVPGEENAD